MQVLGFVAFSSLCLTTGAFAPVAIRGQAKPLFASAKEAETKEAKVDTNKEWITEEFERVGPSDVFGSAAASSKAHATASYLESLAGTVGELQNQFDSLEHMDMQTEADTTPQYFRHPMQGEYHTPNMMFSTPYSPEMDQEISRASLPAMHGKNTDLGELQNQFDNVEHMDMQTEVDTTQQVFRHPMQGEYHTPNMMFSTPYTPEMDQEISKASLPAMHGKNTDLGELQNQFDSVEHMDMQTEVDTAQQVFRHQMQGEYHTPNMMFSTPSSPEMDQEINQATLPAMHGKNNDLGELQNQFDSVEHIEMQTEVDTTPQYFRNPMQGEYHTPNMMFSTPFSPEMDQEINKESLPAMHGKNNDLGELQNQFDSVEHIEMQTEVDTTPQYVRHPTQGEHHTPNMMFNMPSSPQ